MELPSITSLRATRNGQTTVLAIGAASLSLLAAATTWCLGIFIVVGVYDGHLTLDELRWRWTCSIFSLLLLIGIARLLTEAIRRTPALASSAAAFVLLATAIDQWLFWTNHRGGFILRASWLGSIIAVALLHVTWLTLRSAGRNDALYRALVASTILFALLLATLAFHRSMPPTVGPIFATVLAIPLTIDILGSAAVALRHQAGRRESSSLAARLGLFAAYTVALLVIGFGAGRWSTPRPQVATPFDAEQFDRQLASDQSALQTFTTDNAAAIEALARVLPDLIAQRTAEARVDYLPRERDTLLDLFAGHLARRQSLHQLVNTYTGVANADGQRRENAGSLAANAAAAITQTDAEWAVLVGNDDATRQLLDAGDAARGIATGAFTQMAGRLVDLLRRSPPTSRPLSPAPS